MGGGRAADAATQDELIARLKAYQDVLEAAAKDGPKSFKEAFAKPPAGICIHEFDAGGIRLVNKEVLRILGYTAEQMLGKPIWEFVVMETASRESVQKKLKGEKDIKPFVRTFRKADGSGVAMLLYDRRLVDAQGEPNGIRTAMVQVGQG